MKKQVLADATLRAGDALFKENNYNSAIKYYDEAINKKYSGYVYALYQKAIIEGLRGNPTDQILALERLTEQYPKSEFSTRAACHESLEGRCRKHRIRLLFVETLRGVFQYMHDLTLCRQAQTETIFVVESLQLIASRFASDHRAQLSNVALLLGDSRV